MNIKQLEIEIQWLKDKIESLDPKKVKQIKDLKRQIRQTEVLIAFNEVE